MTTMLKV